MSWETLKNRDRGTAGTRASPRGAQKAMTLPQIRAANASEWTRHPERKPSPVRRLSPAELRAYEASLKKC